uniref:Intersectin 2b n=1 Tax=Electrophorus electricus TaxID=8005 RepID=A0A4W4E9K4_ELEEL
LSGGRSIWAITPEERDKHDQKFDTLSPTQGCVSGEQARKFFLQSGLPSSVLAEIWTLADMNKDGKMDRLEFSIAMKLIKMKLQGQNLPSALPIIMKQPPVPAPTMPITPLAMASMPNVPMMPTVPILGPMPLASTLTSLGPLHGMTPMMPTGMAMPIMPTISPPSLPNGPIGILQPAPVSLTSALPLNSSFTSTPLVFPSAPSGLLDLGSSSSSSSSNASLAGSSPKTSHLDWAVPQSSRLKYRQQFNILDKQMTGCLTGPQVRNAMASTPLTQTQLATIWNLADVDKDGKLKAEEFILAMHLVDMAKQGQPLPLTLPADLVPPTLRGKVAISLNGATSTASFVALTEEFAEVDPPQKSKNNLTFEDKFKKNLELGNAELEKRRQALQEQQRREEERRAQKAREVQERREREARELELRRQREEEQRRRKQDLQSQKSQEQEDIIRLKAKKRSLELELEAVGNKHKQITDRLRDAQAKKRVQRTELDRINQRRDSCIIEINALQQQSEELKRKLAQLAPEQQKLNETLRAMNLNNMPTSTMTTLKKSVAEKDLSCRKLKERLDALEKDTATKLADMDQYKKDIQDLRETQRKQQAALVKLRSVKEDKLRELKRCKEEELDRKKKEEEEQRRIKQEKQRQWQEKLRHEEEERQRKLQEEREAKLREEEERERQARLQAAKEQAERERRAREEERRHREEEEERRRREEEEERRRREEEERREHPLGKAHRKSAALTKFKALYPFVARNEDELSFEADDSIEVDETVEREEGWLYGSRQGKMGWFPESYVERQSKAEPPTSKPALKPQASLSISRCTADGSSFEEYVALYTYKSPEHGDLTFSEGDTILVTKREGEWWRGSIGDRSGLFPSNYVKPKETDTSSLKPGMPGKKPDVAQVTTPYVASGSEQLSLSPGQLILILSKNPTGWWLGELQVRGKKRQKGWFPASHVKQLGSNSGKSTPATVAVCQVIAIYDYMAANKDELSFSKSQIINVLDKSDPDWWKGELNGATGLFPTNYVKMTTSDCDPSQQWCADLTSLDSMTPQEKKRQGYIHELIETEERYMEDLQLVLEVFYKPMSESGRLNEAEMNMIFVNWKELIMSNMKLLKAFRVRKKMGGEKMPVQMIGDILAAELSHMQAYIRFCSCQLNAAALLQQKTDQEPEFKDFLKKIATDYRCKGMPLSSFLLKPMQRITRYPLHIKNILESTPDSHVDHVQLREALEKAEELCLQVNEGVREKENSDRLEWIQSHVQCEGITENLIFNSLTNCLGPRKLLHSGKIFKTKSNKELHAFLFNDFLLLTQAVKQFTSSGLDKLFSPKSNTQYKMYKSPVFLNEVLVKLPSDPSSDEPIFHISHIDRVYTLRTENINERTAWVQKIKAASEEFIETEKKKRERAYQARSMKASGIGRLLVTIQEATELKSSKASGKSNPYCEVTMGAQCYTSRTLNDTLNPKWNFNCQFHIKDLYQDVLCITIYEREQFAPDDFLGRTEVPVATIKKELENKGPAIRRLLLHEVPTGEVWVRLDLQLFDGKNP